ncbi:non-heme iron oxygenase ferredoxin subunit [Kutzneria chonburiensis]|uniref:Non-heme iron oxygenase ferredoxin subunit n=1 Tax=Kutzneria chonburiensis TaxID=1483604 RepID=A0ABV6NAE3_9PSEU|nr:non-heme iron oxygenase ferredoxin subunit [Kutzneria chonburiensis]
MLRACSLADLEDGKPFPVELADTPIVLVRGGDEVHALRDECTHAEIALAEGELTRKGLECWLHGSCFDLRTGAPSSPPATEPVAVYAVTVSGDDVLVDPSHRTN